MTGPTKAMKIEFASAAFRRATGAHNQRRDQLETFKRTAHENWAKTVAVTDCAPAVGVQIKRGHIIAIMATEIAELAREVERARTALELVMR